MERGGFKQDRKTLPGSGAKRDESSSFQVKDLITPVLIAWLNSLAKAQPKDDALRLDDCILDKVTVVARITKIQEEQSKVRITIDDGTGILILTCNKKQNEETPRALKHVTLKSSNQGKCVC